MIAIWLLAAMLAWAAPTSSESPHYRSIADDLALVAIEAPLFAGEDGAAETALLLASFAATESMFRSDVDLFLPTGLGDHGAAHGLLQVHLRPGEACRDRLTCLRLGRERMRESMAMCHSLPLADRLAGFTGGSCSEEVARAASRWRVRRALAWWDGHRYLPAID